MIKNYTENAAWSIKRGVNHKPTQLRLSLWKFSRTLLKEF